MHATPRATPPAPPPVPAEAVHRAPTDVDLQGVVGRARLALARGDVQAAKRMLDSHAQAATDPTASFVRGLVESRLGNGRAALALLEPFAAKDALTIAGVTDGEAPLLLLAALAQSRVLVGDPAGALADWDRYARLPEIRDHERAYARARAGDLAARLPAEDALRLASNSATPYARAAAAPRAIAALRARGEADKARRLEEETAALRRSLGFEGAAPWLGPGDPHRLGLAVPMSGRLQVLGEVALRGAMLAIGEPGAGGEIPRFEAVVRDTAAGAEAALRSASELVREEAAIGIVGLGDPRVLDQASRDGVPFLTLDERSPGRESTVFQIIHNPEARAAELARRARALGARTFAVLGPESPAGHRLADAFVAAVAAGGGRVLVRATYPDRATTFTAGAALVRRAATHAVFVPDDAQRLELVAPALAAADVWSRPWSAAAVRHASAAGAGKPREVLLLSTATALSRNLIKNAGRYVQGALLAPGFFAFPGTEPGRAFVASFRQLYGNDPSATDAYSYDAVRLLRAAVERGARTRTDVLRRLEAESTAGVTGTIRFGADHSRADTPLLYVVDGDEIRALP